MQKLILIQDCEPLGRRGAVVSVRNGHARNFLLPKGLGVLANADNLKRLEGLRTKFQAEEKVRAEQARTMAERLADVTLTIAMKASEEGHLYGSVSVGVLHEALAEKGLEIESRAIKLAEPIKDVGVYAVPLLLHETVKAELKVYVVKDSGSYEAAASGEGPAAEESTAEAAPAGEAESSPPPAA